MDGAFGEWVDCTGPNEHYRLGDTFLCGTKEKPSGKPLDTKSEKCGRGGTTQVIITGTFCPKCRDLNTVRWAKMYTNQLPSMVDSHGKPASI